MRLNKFLSHHGICSRRDGDLYIQQGRVSVNNQVITSPYIVQETDVVSVDGKIINHKPEPTVWLYYKPVGLVTTHRDEKHRPTVFEQDNVKKLGHVVSVGRLDINSEGLLLLTNNPDFAHYAEHPKNKLTRMYKVRVFGDLDPNRLDDLKNGITIDGIRYGSIIVDYEINKTGMNHWLFVTLTEGKNREIRKVLNHLNLSVNRLIRVAYGDYELGDLKPGELTKVALHEKK
ncbi:MAG: Ribosomal large subunit pseudouridine synthase B [Holosporales bacterium]